MDGRPCTEQPELAGRGSGGTGDRNHRAMKAGKWGRLCHRSSWQGIGWSSEVPSAGSGPSGPPNTALGSDGQGPHGFSFDFSGFSSDLFDFV